MLSSPLAFAVASALAQSSRSASLAGTGLVDMAVNLTYAWCSGITYNVSGYTWAVSSYVHYAEGACTGFTSDNGVWVTIPLSDFEQILFDANAYNGASSSGAFTSSEITALKYQAANPSPWNLSVEDGYLVSGAIVGVWVVAWTFRALYLTLRSDGYPTE